MLDDLPAELERFAATLIEAQESLLQILRRKRAALTSADLKTISSLQVPETAATERLEELVAWRARILESTRLAGRSAATLMELAQSLSKTQSERILDQLKTAQRMATGIRNESWVQWVITNRCCNFFSEVVELIANGGKKAPTYHQQAWTHRGGAVLDANA